MPCYKNPFSQEEGFFVMGGADGVLFFATFYFLGVHVKRFRSLQSPAVRSYSSRLRIGLRLVRGNRCHPDYDPAGAFFRSGVRLAHQWSSTDLMMIFHRKPFIIPRIAD
ncbi:hypothetical protein [Chryseobacterium sp. MFBS3-17]|uniref:hypothetical protein n=1 Tax=Chryseobacterium sp. MFBS3-17 TaxID=2886689 RepID=UPI001D0E328B|nr:hypothetical protein [Chryseobacterium sp. MFBS3-17]MCC2589484.1 hypothetical protein [Chryseobacterium sp. MFBS3-17]